MVPGTLTTQSICYNKGNMAGFRDPGDGILGRGGAFQLKLQVGSRASARMGSATEVLDWIWRGCEIAR